tara:strand:+ start:37752 stop:42755 length:5004 start_codon:yes stop_codon:yes gene_type:complete
VASTPKALSPAEQEEQLKQDTLAEWQNAKVAGGAALSNLNPVQYGTVYDPHPPNTDIAFSGSDCQAFLVTYGAISRSNFTPVPNLAAISYSVHRDKSPVRRLGDFVAREYTKGARTIAGTIVLINFDRAAFYELVHGRDIYGAHNTQVSLADEIPPFDMMLMFSEETKGQKFPSKVLDIGKGGTVGNYSHMWIRGIRLVDEGSVTGTEEDYMETSFQYVAEHVDYLKPNNVIDATSTIAEIQKDLTKAVKASLASPVPAEPYRLFDPQTPEDMQFDLVPETQKLQFLNSLDQELTSTFSDTVEDYQVTGVYNVPNVQVWAADQLRLTIDSTTQPARLAQAKDGEITPIGGTVKLVGSTAAEEGEFQIEFDPPTGGTETLGGGWPDDRYYDFVLYHAYSSNAGSLSDPNADQPGFLAQLFGADPIALRWGNQFSSDFHNIGKKVVHEIIQEPVLYDPITMGQPTSNLTSFSIPVSGNPVYHAFYEEWTSYNPGAGLDHFVAFSSIREHLCYTVPGQDAALDVTITESDILNSETIPFSYTVPREEISLDLTYTWHPATHGYTDARSSEIAVLDPLPFIDAEIAPADYFSITVPHAPEGGEATSFVMATKTLTALVPPPLQITKNATKNRAGPGYTSKIHSASVTPSSSNDVVSETFTSPQAIANDISSFVIKDPSGAGGGIYDKLSIESFSQSGDVLTGATTVEVKGFWSDFDGTFSASGPASVNTTTATQASFVYSSDADSQVIDSIGDMLLPERWVADVISLVPDLSASAITHPTYGLPPKASVDMKVSAFVEGEEKFTVTGARSPEVVMRYLSGSEIEDTSTLFGVLGTGPIGVVGLKNDDGSTESNAYAFSDMDGTTGHASVSLTWDSLGTHPTAGKPWEEVLTTMGANFNYGVLASSLLKYSLPIDENDVGYYINFPGWSFGPWGSNTVTRKLHEGKIILPIEMLFGATAPGNYSVMPEWWQEEYGNDAANVITEIEASLGGVGIQFYYNYKKDIPFEVDYRYADAVAGAAITIPLTSPIATSFLVSEPSINFTVLPGNSMNNSVTSTFDASTNELTLSGFHPGVDSTFTGTFTYNITDAVPFDLHYTTISAGSWESEMWIDLGVKPPIEFDLCDPDHLLLKETTNQAIINICTTVADGTQNGFGITADLTNTDSPTGTADGKYYIHIDNIPPLVLIKEEVGWVGQAWTWLTSGTPAPNAPTGDLLATVNYTVLDGTVDPATGMIIDIPLNLKYNYPTDDAGSYLGDDWATQVKTIGEAGSDPVRYEYDYGATKPGEVRIMHPQGTAENSYVGGSITSPGFTVLDKSNYSSIMNDKKLVFEISGFPVQSEATTLDIEYSYQLLQFPLELSYLTNDTSNEYPDLDVTFEYSFIAEVPIFSILNSAGEPADSSNPVGSYDIIESVKFIDYDILEGDCTGPCTWDDVEEECVCPVTEMSEVVEPTDASQLNGNALYYKDSSSNLVFPTGIHPSDTTTYQNVLDIAGDYGVNIIYKQLTDYTPPSIYDSEGYVLTAMHHPTGFEVAIDTENSRINVNTDNDAFNTGFCQDLGGTWAVTTPTFAEDYLGTCFDGATETPHPSKPKCEAAGFVWEPDTIGAGYCSGVDLDKLIEKQLLVQFSFWLIGPNSDSTGNLEVYKHGERFNTLDKCWKEMITAYNDKFPIQKTP